MSLYFDDRVKKEQSDVDPPGKITFSIRTGINMRIIDEDDTYTETIMEKTFKTIFGVKSLKWNIRCTENMISIDVVPYGIQIAPGRFEDKRFQYGKCTISYDLYNEMRSKIYSSERISLTSSPIYDSFRTPEGSIPEFSNAVTQQQFAGMNIFVELELSTKFFYRPFEISWIGYHKNLCEKYPEVTESDFRFEFLKDSDFTFMCPDGTVPAIKMVLNLTSSFMKKYLKETNYDELVVDQHSIDVVKPVITYLQSRCFQMPKFYDLDFADRLLKAIYFFSPETMASTLVDKPTDLMINVVYFSLCEKFVEDTHDFESVLNWLYFALRHHLTMLQEMIMIAIAEKYFYQFFEEFPAEARTAENQMLQNLFGSANQALRIFKEIRNIFVCTFFNTLLKHDD